MKGWSLARAQLLEKLGKDVTEDDLYEMSAVCMCVHVCMGAYVYVCVSVDMIIKEIVRDLSLYECMYKCMYVCMYRLVIVKDMIVKEKNASENDLY